MKIIVVIPSYKVKKHILSVIESIPDFVSYILVIDDKCPQDTGKIVKLLDIPRVEVIFHEKNQGVGGAVITGYNRAMELDADIVVKVDGDGQMDCSYMELLINPIISNQADYTKGNRFRNYKELKSMPKIRLLGNSVLSFMVKFSSGYWNVMDPTNGYTAINRSSIEDLDLTKLSKDYFFESDMLVNLNIENKVVKDILIPARYADEESSLKVVNEFFNFVINVPKSAFKRIIYKYYIYDFNMVSVYLLFSIPMIFFGGGFGLYKWYESIISGIPATTGSVMLSVVPVVIGIQLLLQSIRIDMENVPRK